MNRILIVEDDEETARLLQLILEEAGFETAIALNGHTGLDLARRDPPDLIVCDIIMPRLSGMEVLKQLRADPALAPIAFIFLTSRDDRADIRSGMETGADDYLPKPIHAPDLVGAVRALLHKQELRQVVRSNLSATSFDVFLSYSHVDSEAMHRVRDSLVAGGLSVWTDIELEPGTDAWERAVVAALNASGCVVALLSPDAECSLWVGRELAMAETLDVRIFPLLIRGDARTAIPMRLISHQRVDVRHAYDEGIDRLVQSIRKYLNLSL